MSGGVVAHLTLPASIYVCVWDDNRWCHRGRGRHFDVTVVVAVWGPLMVWSHTPIRQPTFTSTLLLSFQMSAVFDVRNIRAAGLPCYNLGHCRQPSLPYFSHTLYTCAHTISPKLVYFGLAYTPYSFFTKVPLSKVVGLIYLSFCAWLQMYSGRVICRTVTGRHPKMLSACGWLIFTLTQCITTSESCLVTFI